MLGRAGVVMGMAPVMARLSRSVQLVVVVLGMPGLVCFDDHGSLLRRMA